jgi:hypothetical protein
LNAKQRGATPLLLTPQTKRRDREFTGLSERETGKILGTRGEIRTSACLPGKPESGPRVRIPCSSNESLRTAGPLSCRLRLSVTR